jgi:hypothetical protein
MADALDIVDKKVLHKGAEEARRHSCEYDSFSLTWQVGLQLVQPLFISIDPLRDTPQQLKARFPHPCLEFSCFLLDVVGQEYLKDWHPRLIGLTGTPEQVLTLLLAVVVFLRPFVFLPNFFARAR